MHHTSAVMDKPSDEDVDCPRPCVPLMIQECAPQTRYMDVSIALDNQVVGRPSLVDLSSTESSQPPRSTCSQVISIV